MHCKLEPETNEEDNEGFLVAKFKNIANVKTNKTKMKLYYYSNLRVAKGTK